MTKIQPPYCVDEKKLNRYFWLFIFIHTLAWTVGPALAKYSLPHDTLEGITWGLQWQLGYNKHPFLTAWLCAAVSTLFGSIGWPVYLLAQVAVSLTFFAVWKLAKQILPATHALIAALVLDGVLFYNINSSNLTPDTLQSPLWAGLALCFYHAIKTQRNATWILTGTMAALCLLTKYQVCVLFLPMLLLCIVQPEARLSFKKPGLYLAITTFFILIAPHVIWLAQHQFITLTYATTVPSQYTQYKSQLGHLINPIKFLINALGNVAGLVLLLWPFYNKDKIKLKLSSFDNQFLIFLGLGPFITSLVLCIISGDVFPSRWSTPYFFALGIIMLAYLKPNISKTRLKQFACNLVLFSTLLFVARMSTFTIHVRAASDTFLPNKNIAAEVTKRWEEKYHTTLPFIAGSHYLVAAITPYVPGKPKPYFNWDKQECPWIQDAELKTKGGVFIWDLEKNYAWDADGIYHEQNPDTILQRFPSMEPPELVTFYRVTQGKKPIAILIAILPPANQNAPLLNSLP